jgi:Asp-tRNA(Asn)/Glu-tRNA(Gln) amidotransferase A subunit family amidase
VRAGAAAEAMAADPPEKGRNVSQDLCYLSACEAIEQFRARTLSPVELLRALIERAEKIDPQINAFTYDRFEVALRQAADAEAGYARGADSPARLAGIPVALKNEASMRGEPTTQGSLLVDTVDESTDPMVQRLLDAGAIIHARTNVPEFSCAGFTHTRRHGTTRNPWNLDCTCGGSSGGSGASLAAGTSTLATGSDIGGSIRIPASFCGVVGLKPSYGRVPEPDPLYALDTYNHNGPMARTVADCALLFDSMVGPHPNDLATLRPKLEVPTRFEGIRGWKIALSCDLDFFEVDEDVRRNTLRAADALRALGAEVTEVDLGWDASLADAAVAHLGFLMGSELAGQLETGRELMNPYTVEFAELGQRVTPQAFRDSIRAQGAMYQPLGKLLTRYDAMICPTLARNFWPAAGFEKGLELLLKDMMTWPFNILSRCPVLSVPSGFADNGVPTGLQIVGRTYDDLAVLRIGANLERELDWMRRHPPLG